MTSQVMGGAYSYVISIDVIRARHVRIGLRDLYSCGVNCNRQNANICEKNCTCTVPPLEEVTHMVEYSCIYSCFYFPVSVLLFWDKGVYIPAAVKPRKLKGEDRIKWLWWRAI